MSAERRKIKVLHLITLLELGGAQGNTIYTVTHLDPSVYETHLWCGKGAYWDDHVLKTLGASGQLRFFPRLVRQLHPLNDLIAVVQLWRAMKKMRPEILHTHSSKAGIVGRIAGWLAGVPIVIQTFHGFGFNDEQKPPLRWLFLFLERATARLSTALIFVSQANLELARKEKIGDPARYSLIRSGIPLRAIREVARASDTGQAKNAIGVPGDSILVTTIGAFKPQKNLPDFIRVAAALAVRETRAYFLIIGDGALRGTLASLVVEAGLTERVRMVGWRSDVPSLLAASTVFVLTSLWEGLPRALVEAMALGIPAVCYDTDGVRDLLAKGGGVIVGQRDVPAMVEAVGKLLVTPSARLAFSQQGPALISEEFDIDHMVRQQEELYQRLLVAELDNRRRIN